MAIASSYGAHSNFEFYLMSALRAAGVRVKQQRLSPIHSAMPICPIIYDVAGQWHQFWLFASQKTGRRWRRLRICSRHMAILHLVRAFRTTPCSKFNHSFQLVFYAQVAPSHQISATMPLKSPTWAPPHVPSLTLTPLIPVCFFFNQYVLTRLLLKHTSVAAVFVTKTSVACVLRFWDHEFAAHCTRRKRRR